MEGAGIYEQIQNACNHKVYYTPMTTEVLDNFLNELSIQNKMSKRYYNKKKKMATEQMTDEQIKAVMDLYKPNFIEKLFMKYDSKIETTNKVRNGFIITIGVLFVLGLIFNSTAELIVSGAIALPFIGGTIYSAFTNRKRVIQLMSVLNMTEDQVNALQKKYYLA
jgi:ABC-type antimicrobial peptide transport system permease subunit